jgi:hypothetical protein
VSSAIDIRSVREAAWIGTLPSLRNFQAVDTPRRNTCSVAVIIVVTFTVPNGPWRLDEFNAVSELVHLGREKAAEVIEAIRGTFFSINDNQSQDGGGI